MEHRHGGCQAGALCGRQEDNSLRQSSLHSDTAYTHDLDLSQGSPGTTMHCHALQCNGGIATGRQVA